MARKKSKTYAERLRKASSTLRSLKLSGDMPEDSTLVDFLDKFGIKDTKFDKIIESEAVILYFQLGGDGFVKQRCPVCKEVFAYKYQLTAKLFINPPQILPNMKPAEKAAAEQELEIQKQLKPAFENKFGMKCSNECRAIQLAEIGIKWDPTRRPENRWLPANPIDPERPADGGELPLVIPPKAYQILQDLHDIEPEYVAADFIEDEEVEETS